MKTLKECIKDWMQKYKRNSVKPTTYDRLETSYNALLNYPIAHMDVLTIRTEDLQNYINRLVVEGYALSTIKKQYHLIGSFLKYATAEGIVPGNKSDNVTLPSQSTVKKKKKEVEAYTEQEQQALMKVLRTNSRAGYLAAALMMETGLRVGEALALKWCDVVWGRKALRVNKTLIRIANRKRIEVQNGAKSFTSNRTIPLSSTAFSMLKDLYNNQSHDDFIFQSNGKILSYEAMRWQISHACTEAKVPYKGLHVFRHTFATNCYYRGCDVKILSKLLGHSDVTITYNTYIHLFGDALEEMRSVLG